MYFYAGIGGFLTGILIRSFFDVGLTFVLLLFVLAAGLFVVRWLLREGDVLKIIVLGLCFLALGILRFDFSVSEPNPLVSERIEEQITLEGVVYREPELRENGVRLYVAVERLDETILEEDERIVTTAPFGEYQYGDRVILSGTLRTPEPFETETGRTFAYDTYLAKDGVHFVLSQSNVSVLEGGQGVWVKEVLFGLKYTLLSAVGKIVPEPYASLVGGIVFGVEDALGESLLDAFRRSGLIHIVVLSGFNVAIAADWFMQLASRLPERLRIGTGAVGIVLFAIMTGASATTVRASIMALLALLARSTASRYSITRALTIAIALMVLHNPYIFVFDLSFQLSVLATLGLIFIAPRIEPKLTFLPTHLDIRGLAAATIAAQIAVLPLIAYQIGELSFVGVFANVLVLPTIPWAMWTGFFTGALGSIALPLGIPLGAATYGLLWYVVTVAEQVAALPGAALIIPPFPLFVMLLVYAGIGLLAYQAEKRHRPPERVSSIESVMEKRP